MPPSTDALFRLLADPTRRRILDLLAERGPVPVAEIAAAFPGLVASGISKHLMALRAAGLVLAERRGRQQLYRLDAAVLGACLSPWLARYERHWTGALERLRVLSEAGDDPPQGG